LRYKETKRGNTGKGKFRTENGKKGQKLNFPEFPGQRAGGIREESAV